MSDSDGRPDPKELLATIRQTILSWRYLYGSQTGFWVDLSYATSLGNDIAFELGILEAIDPQGAAPDTPCQSHPDSIKGDA